MSNAVKAWLVVLVVALGAYGGFALRRAATSSPTDDQAPPPTATAGYPFPAGDFQLTTSQDEEFDSRSMRGRVWIASFFFSRCPGACVKLNNQIADLLTKDFASLPVTFVSITVDPDYDSPQVLEDYAQRFYSQQGIDRQRWLFVTDPDGRKSEIQKASDGFKIAFAKLNHSDRLIVIDGEGQVQGSYSDDVGSVKRKVRELLAHK